MPGQAEVDRFLALVVDALDAARDDGLEWRWVERALRNSWATHPGIHRYAPGGVVPDDEHAVALSAP